MTLRFEQILADGIAQTSYVIGDDAAGVAAVIDPRPDVEVYLRYAREYGLAITHIFETHIHADFMSGARELAARLGRAEICLSREGGASYGFAHRSIGDGDRFEFGTAVLRARFTPGHTPEHLAYLVADKGREGDPWAVLSGDSLFVDSAGRPDLLGDEAAERLVEQLFRTLRDVYLAMADHVIVYPCHGAGSECGPDIGDRLASTIGYERRHNPYLQCDRLERFKDLMLAAAPPAPAHYPRLKRVNAAGPEILGAGPPAPALPPARFRTAIEQGGTQLVDLRHMLGFGGGHIADALNIPDQPILSVWAGWMLDPEAPILLVPESDRELERILPLFLRTGYTRFAGHLAGGMTAWEDAGLPLVKLPQMTVHELRDASPELQVLDVRAPAEWANGHVPGAVHCFLPDLRQRLGEFDAGRPLATYCGSGYRASIAASLLQAHGFEHVRSVPGSWKAWRAAGFPVEQPVGREGEG